MASIVINGPPEDPAAAAADPWLDPNDPISIQADEMFARQLDTGFAGEIRTLVNDPETGLAGKQPEDALGGVAEAMPMLGELKDRYLAQAIGPRQRSLLEPLIDSRLDRAAGELGRIAQQATSALDDRVVAERLAGLQKDAALAWRDPAHLRALGRTAVGELRYQGERKGWDATQTDTTVRQSLSDLYAGAIEQAIGQNLDGADDLYEHARDVIRPERRAAIDRRFVEAQEDKTVARVGDDLRAGWAKMSIAPSTADGPNFESTARPRPNIRWFLDQAATQLDDNSSPRLRGLVQNEATAQFFRAGKEWQTGRSQAVAEVLKWKTENPSALFTDVPSSLRSKMSPDQMATFRIFANVQGQIQPDLGLYDRLERDLIDHPNRLTSVELDEYVLDLGVEGVRRLADLQNEIRNGDPAGHVAFARASRRLVENAFVRAGSEVDATLGQTARAQVRHRVADFPKLNGRSPTEIDLVRIVEEETRNLGAEGQKGQTENASSPGVEIAQAPTEQDPRRMDARVGRLHRSREKHASFRQGIPGSGARPKVVCRLCPAATIMPPERGGGMHAHERSAWQGRRPAHRIRDDRYGNATRVRSRLRLLGPLELLDHRSCRQHLQYMGLCRKSHHVSSGLSGRRLATDRKLDRVDPGDCGHSFSGRGLEDASLLGRCCHGICLARLLRRRRPRVWNHLDLLHIDDIGRIVALPEGTYDIKQGRYQSMSGWDRWRPRRWPGGARSWGTERVWADPTKTTVESGLTFGRKDMAIHGGEIPGSAGCIDLTQQMVDFAKKFRHMGVDLKLYVDYSPPLP